jgi:hypothetical protein
MLSCSVEPARAIMNSNSRSIASAFIPSVERTVGRCTTSQGFFPIFWLRLARLIVLEIPLNHLFETAQQVGRRRLRDAVAQHMLRASSRQA